MSSADFSGKVVLITGASSGIGAAIAIGLAQRGARLSLTGRNDANLDGIAADCWRHLTDGKHNNPEQPLTVVAELAKDDDIRRIVEKTIDRFGRLDVLVNNAAFGEFGSIETTSLDQFDRVMAVNIRAPYNLSTLCTPHLIATKGNIINISSTAGSCAFSGILAYSVSKSALDHLTLCSALELAGKGVRVNGIVPGTVGSTNMRKRAGLSDAMEEKHLEDSKHHHPLGRVGEPGDIVQAVIFLASDDASFITGENMYVDGGGHLATKS